MKLVMTDDPGGHSFLLYILSQMCLFILLKFSQEWSLVTTKRKERALLNKILSLRANVDVCIERHWLSSALTTGKILI